MKMVFWDAETFYTKDFNLRKMTPAEYIMHPWFELISVGVQVDGGPVDVIPGCEFRKWLSAYPPEQTIMVAYNSLFDQSILAFRYNYVPARMVDCLGLARYALAYKLSRLSLEKVSEYFGLHAKGDTMHMGLSYNDLVVQGLWDQHVTYTKRDVANCHEIFNRLAPGFPAGEWAVMDLVLRACVQPKFQPNIEMLRTHHAKLVVEKENLIERSGLTREQLSSANEFAAALEAYGVTVETKVTDKGNVIPAVAKTDNFMKELAEHEDEYIRLLAEARLGVKSTLEESRTARLLSIAELPWTSAGFATPVMPVPLRYAGPHTQRLSGEWKINMQNLPKAKKDKPAVLRNSLEAPPGHAVVVADLGQIEARLTAWLSNSPLIEAFRQGTDVYKAMAASIFNTAETRVTENERFVGKAAVLGLGFGLGANNFYSKTVVNARMQGQDITAFFTQELAQKTVDVYRLVNKNTVRLWYLLDDLLRYEWMGRRDPRQVGPLTIGHGLVTGPGGLQMRYDVPYGPGLEKYPAYGEDIFYKYSGRPHKIYGAAFLENCLTADTQVLTINGWKPIVDVRTDEEVWDGQAWVHHNGVISRGYRTIGRLDGIGLTAEHEVMTSDGWIRAAQTQGFYWADIRVPDRFAGCWDNEPKEIMARSMCLWNRISSFIEYTKTQTLLWMQIRRTTEASQKSWNEQTSSILGVAFNVRPVSFANTPSVEKLWWPGHSRLQTVGKIRKFLGRYGANLQARINTGKVKEWPWLQFKKLYLGVLFGSSTQPPGLAHNFYPLGRYDRCRGSQKIEDWADDFTLPYSQRLAPRALVYSSTSEVFDLLNSGPRHCFVVRGRTGPRLVHNCIQFLARIIFFNATVRIAKQGYPFAHTAHDELALVVPEKDVDVVKELVHKELTTPPSWAPDLPLKASVSSGKSYGEAK